MNEFKNVICDSHVKIVTLKQVGNVIWTHTYNINTKEWYFTKVREKVSQMQQLYFVNSLEGHFDETHGKTQVREALQMWPMQLWGESENSMKDAC